MKYSILLEPEGLYNVVRSDGHAMMAVSTADRFRADYVCNALNDAAERASEYESRMYPELADKPKPPANALDATLELARAVHEARQEPALLGPKFALDIWVYRPMQTGRGVDVLDSVSVVRSTPFASLLAFHNMVADGTLARAIENGDQLFMTLKRIG